MRLHEIENNIEKLLLRYFLIDGVYEIDENGLVNVDGSVRLRGTKISKLPVKFGKVFNTCKFQNLSNLEGCPTYVGGDFDCRGNSMIRRLSSLKGSPTKIDGNFNCSNNMLISLEGGPTSVGDSYSCSHNKLKSLKGAPEKVKSFDCNNNQLTSLIGGPTIVETNYFCLHNPIQSLDGIAEHIKYSFQFDYTPNIPLLKLISSDILHITCRNLSLEGNNLLDGILKKYMGQGRKGAIQCAAELTKAGFKGNARL